MKKRKLLLLGLSTGGPRHIQTFLKSFQKSNSTIIIAQHMKENVLPFFFKDLQESYKHDIQQTPIKISDKSNKIILCTSTCKIKKETNYISIIKSINEGYYTPDIDILFKSAYVLLDKFDICAVLLTGIGSDGVAGLKLLKDGGAYTIAESEKSAPVFGMPRSAIEANAVTSTKSLNEIIVFLNKEGYINV